MLIIDVWFRIVFYCDGTTRQKLSSTNRNFRKMITTEHIHLLKQERVRLYQFLTNDIKSTTVKRFHDDFNYLMKTWKPPKDHLLLHYVDYHFHLLYIIVFLLQHYEVIQLFFHFTNDVILKENNIVLYIIEALSCYATPNIARIVFNFLKSIDDYQIIDDSIPIPQMHEMIFQKYQFIQKHRDLYYISYDSHISEQLHNHYESHALRFFSLSDIIRRRNTNKSTPYFSLDFAKIYERRNILPQFINLHPKMERSYSQLLMAPYVYQQLHNTINNECQSFIFENIITTLCKHPDPVNSLKQLFQSKEYKIIKLIESPETISETMFEHLIIDQQRERLGVLYSKYLKFTMAFKNNLTNYFCFWRDVLSLTDEQLDEMNSDLTILENQTKDKILNFFSDCFRNDTLYQINE